MKYLEFFYRERLDSYEVELMRLGEREVRDVAFVKRGLEREEVDEIREVVPCFVREGLRKFLYLLDRCTFFAEFGFDYLEKVLRERTRFANPRIEGDDADCDNQHYWLAFDVKRLGAQGNMIVDPIFGFVGLESSAKEVMRPEFVDYYNGKRIVQPHKPVEEGGVRIKTIGI